MDNLYNVFLNSVADYGIGANDFAAGLLFTLIMALIMGITYKVIQTELSYNPKFNINLMMMSFLSNVLITLVQDNPFLSLGAIGSLSICRIRMNTKDPRDLGFVFWALSIGIVSAIGAYMVGVISTVSLAVILMILDKVLQNRRKSTLVVRGAKQQLVNVQKIFSSVKGLTVQSKNIFADSFEVVYEFNGGKSIEDALIVKLEKIDGLYGVNVLAPETRAA